MHITEVIHFMQYPELGVLFFTRMLHYFSFICLLDVVPI